ncbi:MAG: cysteine--tRNA ligase [Bacteroidetes bacterium]|nr:cysteine--tRNA ligase [Bacteroidota bacterium]
MENQLFIYNTLTKTKELFKPLNPPFVGFYVCGPTVYSDVHLGNCRTFMSFDVMYRYLSFLGYKVRYVRNITDAGHLESDGDVGEDKISKRAKLEQKEPMEIVQHYTVDFREVMKMFNISPPSIEPTATGHIVEQIEIAKKIIENGYAYELNGTVYCDVEKLNKLYNYGQLSGRNLDDLLTNTRDLDGQDEKKGKLDFAVWIKAKPEHLQQWPSPWGMGFPGWHIECSAMSTKYLGEQFDIHGGGMDLVPTHHTNEIAQNMASCGKGPANYWVHTNMLTVNGQKMSKSLGNSFLPHELFSGNHPLLEKGYSAMAVKFFMLQTHYSSTLDFSNEALQASEKGFARLMEAMKTVENLVPSTLSSVDVKAIRAKCYEAMNDDFNTPILLAQLFEAVRVVNSVNDKHETLTADDIAELRKLFADFVVNVLGLKQEETNNKQTEVLDKVVKVVLDMRVSAKQNKDFKTSDELRDKLLSAGVTIKDSKEGSTWALS